MKNRNLKSKALLLMMAGSMSVYATGCAKQAEDELSGANVVAANPNANQTIGDEQNQVTILGGSTVAKKIADGSVSPTGMKLPANPSSLIASFPLSLLNKPMVLGAVITQVSDAVSEDMGQLKLTDIPPLQVQGKVETDSTGSFLVLYNCAGDCTAKDLKPMLAIPSVGTDAKKKAVLLDLAALGADLDLTALFQGHPTIDKYESKSSKTVRFDYSKSTLVFDVQADLTKKGDTTNAVTTITNRWYIKLADSFNPAFVSREPVAGVGFFETERSPKPLIQRWDFDKNNKGGIKYYFKHVPADWQAAFAGCMDEWNTRLQAVIGKKVFSYEFIPEGDARNDLLTTGDVRYNVVEWDLLNKAPYGGLGPSIANQYTGEEFAANVLIQGPTIMTLYTEWFKTAKKVQHLMAAGHVLAAQSLMLDAERAAEAQAQDQAGRKFTLKMGKGALAFVVRSQQPALEDPLTQRPDFELLPDGVTFKSYMDGYFHDMLTHELGHNLGLRHNFFGNLGAGDKLELGKVSRSVMEYLGRGFRHLDLVGDYDMMALSYGYTGATPKHTDWFCTDEDKADLADGTKSAECSSDDATNDPVAFFQARLARAMDLLVAKGQPAAPEWTVPNMARELTIAVTGLGTYAGSADKTFATWTNFAGPGRPKTAAGVRPWILGQLKSELCDAGLKKEVAAKATAADQAATQANIDAVRAEVAKELAPVFSAADLACQ